LSRIITPQDFQFKTVPYDHQDTAFERSRDLEDFAYLMEMGTGKTKVGIDVAAWKYAKGEINFLFIVAPNGVQRNWVLREIPVHLPDWVERRVCVWSSYMKAADWKDYDRLWDPKFTGLRILVINVDAFGVAERFWRTKRGGPMKFGTEIAKILNSFSVYWIMDESTKIKTPGSRRTKRILTLGKRAHSRAIMTGTPVTNSPMDLYAQFKFLGPGYLGYTNFHSFKHRYAEWQTEKNWKTEKEYEVCTGYKNLDELVTNIDAVSYRVTKKECLDLPDKLYERRYVGMQEDQGRIYNKVLQDAKLELAQADDVTVANVLTKMIRLQQVLGGFIPNEAGGRAEACVIPNFSNLPRAKAIKDIVEDSYILSEEGGKLIIWARFVPEIENLTRMLAQEYDSDTVVNYYGAVGQEDRDLAIDRFQNDDRCRFFIGQQQSGGFGLTLTAASYVAYYSNDFSLENRLQSEDRAHRIGQKNNVTYFDLETLGTIDTRIINALRAKKSLADTITRDDVDTWL